MHLKEFLSAFGWSVKSNFSGHYSEEDYEEEET